MDYGKYYVLDIVVEWKLEFWVLERHQERVLMPELWVIPGKCRGTKIVQLFVIEFGTPTN